MDIYDSTSCNSGRGMSSTNGGNNLGGRTPTPSSKISFEMDIKFFSPYIYA
jgi:hypothetical protein